MAGPFFNAIKGTTAGTPGTGAFTPNAASAGYLAWSVVPTGWIGLVRFEDGAAWELQYGYWNGTTLSRSATAQFVSSSTGSALTLSVAATATLAANGFILAANGYVPRCFVAPIPGTTTFSTVGMPVLATVGTLSAVSISANTAINTTPRVRSTSATTANAQSSYSSTTVLGGPSSTTGNGGYLFSSRFGYQTIATARAFIGMTGTTFVANTGEPSAFTASYAVCGRDSTDTNFQFLMNSNVGAGTKIDTGIAQNSNSFFELYIWNYPGSLTTYFLMVDQVVGTIFYSSSSADAPASGTGLMPQMICGLAATTGTAVVLDFGGMSVNPGLF